MVVVIHTGPLQNQRYNISDHFAKANRVDRKYPVKDVVPLYRIRLCRPPSPSGQAPVEHLGQREGGREWLIRDLPPAFFHLREKATNREKARLDLLPRTKFPPPHQILYNIPPSFL
jgi:hypothetical protein